MSRLIVILITFLILSIAGIYLVNEAFKQMDLDILSGLGVIFSSLGPGETASPSLEVSQGMVEQGVYNRFFNEKSQMEQALESAEPFIAEFNNDTDFTSTLKNALGEYYSVYAFTYVDEPVRMKVFEWSLVLEQGLVTVFEPGKIEDTVSLEVEVDHSLAFQMLEGNVTQTDIMDWVASGSIKVRPVFEIFRLMQLVPTLMGYLQV